MHNHYYFSTKKVAIYSLDNKLLDYGACLRGGYVDGANFNRIGAETLYIVKVSPLLFMSSFPPSPPPPQPLSQTHTMLS